MLVISMLLFGFPIGFAVTPINHAKMKKPRLHGALTAFAGPLANMILCGLLMLIIIQLTSPERIGDGLGISEFYALFLDALVVSMSFNAFLAVFNLLPIPPLDGGRIVGSMMKPDLAREWAKIGQYGILIIVGLSLFCGNSFTNLMSTLTESLTNIISSIIL